MAKDFNSSKIVENRFIWTRFLLKNDPFDKLIVPLHALLWVWCARTPGYLREFHKWHFSQQCCRIGARHIWEKLFSRISRIGTELSSSSTQGNVHTTARCRAFVALVQHCLLICPRALTSITHPSAISNTICRDHPTVNVRGNRRSRLVGKSRHLSSREPGTEENPFMRKKMRMNNPQQPP